MTNIPAMYSNSPYMVLIEDESPLRRKFRRLHRRFLEFLVDCKLQDHAYCNLERLETGEAVFGVYLGPNDLQNARALRRIEFYTTTFIDRHFGSLLHIEPLYWRIFNTGPMGRLRHGFDVNPRKM